MTVFVLTPPDTIVHPTVKTLGQQELMVALAKRALQSTASSPDDSYIHHHGHPFFDFDFK